MESLRCVLSEGWSQPSKAEAHGGGGPLALLHLSPVLKVPPKGARTLLPCPSGLNCSPIAGAGTILQLKGLFLTSKSPFQV